MAMHEAAARRDYEGAALLRDDLNALDRMADRQRLFAAPVHEVHAFLVEDAVEPETVQVLAIRHGRHVGTLALPRVLAAEDNARLAAFLAAHLVAAGPPARYFKREIDEVRLLAHWLYVHRASARIVRVEAADSSATVLARIRDALVAPDDGVDDDDADLLDADDEPDTPAAALPSS